MQSIAEVRMGNGVWMGHRGVRGRRRGEGHLKTWSGKTKHVE
jgi:hypothetical protein